MGRTGFTLFVSLASIVVLGAPAAAESPTSAPAEIQKQLAQVLAYVPVDTHLAVVVPDQQALGAGLSAVAAAAGLPELQDAAATPMLRRALGRNLEALRAHGPLVVALSTAHPDPLVLGLMGDTPPGGKEVALALPGGARLTEMGDAGFLATTPDGVAIVARDKAELQRALESNGRYAQRFASLEGVWKGAPQLVLHVDLPAWRGQVQQQLDVVAQGMYLGMAAAGPDGEMAMAMWKWIFGEIHQLLAEADQYVVAIRLDADGLYFHDRLQVGPDGHLARYLAAVKRSEKPLLRGLPGGGAWLMAFGTEWALPPEIEPLEARLLRVMFSPEMLGDKVDRTAAETALEVSLDALRHTSGYSAVITTPDPNGPPAYAGVYFSAQGSMFCQRMRKVYELNPELFQARLSLAASVKHAEEPLGKGTADVYSYAFSTTDAQLAPFLEALYGTNPVIVMAPHAEGSFFVMGEGGVARRFAGQLAEGQGAALIDDPRVQTLLGRLTPHPQMCIVVDVPRVVNWVGRITAPLGVRLPTVETAAETPLAGYAFYLDQRAIRSELYVPVEPVRRIIAVFRQSPPERTATQPASAPAPASGAAAQ